MKSTSLLLVLFVFFVLNIKAQTTVNDTDGNQYNTITIGTQMWTKENLKTTKYNDGTSIDSVSNNSAWSNLTTGAYCKYPTYGDIYGNLYNFYAVANPKNLCPTGWHVATYDEWNILVSYLGGSTVAGSKLKEVGTLHWGTPNTDATNESGFSAFGGGYRNFNGIFYNILDDGYYWHATETGSDYAWYSVMDPSSGYLNITDNDKKDGMSVRCVKNPTTGIADDNYQLFNLYPNPVSDFVTINLTITNSDVMILNFYNVIGAIVKSETLNQNQQQVYVGDLENGIYLVELKSKEWTEKKKLLIQK